MTRDDPPFSPPPSPPDPSPVLNYLSPDPFARIHRPPRKPLPTPLCIGFASACLAIILAWSILYWLTVHHCAWFIFGVVTVTGAVLCAMKKFRLAGIGIIAAADLWFLMIGFCYAIGVAMPFVL